MVGGDAYRRDDVGISALEEDVEDGGGAHRWYVRNGAQRQGARVRAPRRGESIAHFAWCWIRDVAFAEARAATPRSTPRARVKTPAKVLFAQDATLMGRLTDIDERIKKDGLDALASADAKAFRAESRAPDVRRHAGTFARALG